jgi:hypothetical protein
MMQKAQSTLEVTVVLAIFIAALLSMATYIKRGMQGNYRNSADELGSQYEPENTTADRTYSEFSSSITDSETVEDAGKLKTTTNSNENNASTRSGWEEVGPLN